MPDILSEKAWFRRLKKAAITGEPVDLRPDNEGLALANPEHADLWSIQRVVPANAVRRILTLPEAVVKTFDPRGLWIVGARIDGDTDWSHIAFARPLGFALCAFNSTVNLCNARMSSLHLTRCTLTGLWLDQSRIDGGLFCMSLTSHGGIRAIGARIGGMLNLTDATVANPTGFSLHLDFARIDGPLLANFLTATGGIAAAGVHVGGELGLTDATLTNLNGPALNLSNARIDGSLFANRLTSIGEIRATGTHIGGALNLTDATVTNPTGRCLGLDSAHIDGALFIRNLTAKGEIFAVGVHVGGELGLTDATLTNLNGPALNLYNARIDGTLFANRLTSIGEIRAVRAHIGGELDLTDATLSNTEGSALKLTGAALSVLVLRPKRIRGSIHLELTTIDTFVLPLSEGDKGAPFRAGFADTTMHAAGWSVTDFNGAIRRDWRVARAYLERTKYPEFVPQPWFELADVYDRAGHPEQARSLRLHAESQITCNTHGVTKAIRRIYAATVGYGYRPFLPVLWLFGVLVVSGFLIWANQAQFLNATANSPTTANDVCTDTSGYACFNTIGYTLQNVVPTASGPLRPDWVLTTSGWWPIALGIALAVLRLMAWGFAALTLAAMTGLLRKR